MERVRSKPCRRSPNEGSPPPHNLRRAASYGLHDGVFKKSTTPECRHRPIRGSWVFTRSTKGGREKPQRRLQEGNDVRGRRRRGPGRSRARVSSRHHLSATQTWRGTPLRGSHNAPTKRSSLGTMTTPCPWPQPAPKPRARPPTHKVPTIQGRRPGVLDLEAAQRKSPPWQDSRHI
jgi:hypothetical protein